MDNLRSIKSLIKLNNGSSIPALGFGTANLGDRQSKINAFESALENGYRHFDTASMYGNENELGEVLNNSRLQRKELFITTKLWNSDQGYEQTKKAFFRSLKNLNLEFIDLYLTHWPVPEKRLESWKAMEELQKEGVINSLGVSNYTTSHLQELLEFADILPVINQVEFNPFLYQKELFGFCKDNRIILEAYSPVQALVKKKSNNKIIQDIAKNHNKTMAQIVIRWSLQLGNSVIPRSSNPNRIRENSTVFDFQLNTKEMKALGKLDENLRLEWDPTNEP